MLVYGINYSEQACGNFPLGNNTIKLIDEIRDTDNLLGEKSDSETREYQERYLQEVPVKDNCQIIVKDEVYDQHLKELQILEKEYNFILPNSPTQKIGHSISHKFRPIYREKSMLSLDSVDNYEELIKTDSKLLANPRNAASGSLRTLVPLQNRKLHFFAYQLFNSTLDSQSTCLRELEKLGFAVSPDYQLCKGIEKTKEFIQKHEPKRLNLDFESDGIVVKPNKKHLRRDIKGLSQKNIEKIYQNNLIKKPIDFYQLDQKREELLKLEALGIPLLSSVKAKKLSIFYPNLASIRIIIENDE
nr:8846_t:CDS:2 [Entrophospora candida]